MTPKEAMKAMKIKTNIMLPDGHEAREVIEIPDDWDDDKKDKATWEWVENIASVWWEDIE